VLSRNYTLVSVVGTIVFLGNSGQAIAVLQAERCLVSLGHFASSQVEDIEGGKNLHAVEMPVE